MAYKKGLHKCFTHFSLASSPQQRLATCQDKALQAKVQEFWFTVMLPPYIFGRIIFLSNNHNSKSGMLCICMISFCTAFGT